MTTLTPFDLPLVMEQIGTHLDPKDLIPCTLVCKDWHSQFAPFIWWYILEDCDNLLRSIYYKHKNHKPDTSPKITAPLAKESSTDKPTFHLETEFIRIISEYTQKIDNSSSVFHRQRRTRLEYNSFLSFILMGWLCNNVREIKFVYREPVSFVNHESNPSDMYRMSDQYCNTDEKPDRVVEILERSRSLEDLYLKDSNWTHGRGFEVFRNNLVYRWISLASTPVSVPQWPKLVSVTLINCTIYQDFLNILLINSPSIQCLHLYEITFRSKTEFEIFDFQHKREANGNESSSKVLPENTHPHPLIQELTLRELQGVTLRQQMLFASQLQKLERFSFTSEVKPFPVLFLGSGFQALQSLDLTQIRSERDTAGPSFTVIIRTAFRIEDLKISSTLLTVPLYRAIKGHCGTLTNLSLDHCSSTHTSPDLLHHLLRSCPHLKSFSCLNGAKLYCAPHLFEQQPWACTEIESLSILPDCLSRDASYTSSDARAAFFRQLSCLTNLRELDFARGVGINAFVVEEGLYLLMQHLGQLEILSVGSPGLETNANLTREHAMLFENVWPNLKAIKGLYHMDREDFVAYMREHRPEVSLSYI